LEKLIDNDIFYL